MWDNVGTAVRRRPARCDRTTWTLANSCFKTDRPWTSQVHRGLTLVSWPATDFRADLRWLNRLLDWCPIADTQQTNSVAEKITAKQSWYENWCYACTDLTRTQPVCNAVTRSPFGTITAVVPYLSSVSTDYHFSLKITAPACLWTCYILSVWS